MATAVFGGGCFWCTEAIFRRIPGVTEVLPGYAGGHSVSPTYREICGGHTGHAEVIKVEFDPEVVSFRELLEIFFAVHDPTTLNCQGADTGEQYRSAIFYSDREQQKQAEEYIAQLATRKVFSKPVVTRLQSLDTFYEAEKYHHDYYEQNKEQPYCRLVIAPKLAKFKAT